MLRNTTLPDLKVIYIHAHTADTNNTQSQNTFFFFEPVMELALLDKDGIENTENRLPMQPKSWD